MSAQGTLAPPPATWRTYVAAARPRQWLKNGFVAGPALFAGHLGRGGDLLKLGGAIACFCLASSAVYFVNDVLDRHEDNLHPDKRNRPIAAGLIGPRRALGIAAVLGALAVGLAVAVEPWLALVIASYLAMSACYVLWMKRQVILDVMWLAAGFVLRVVAGAVAVRVEPSVWILVCTGLLALMLALGKRRGEIASLGGDAGARRAVLGHYSLPFLDAMLVLTAGATLASYSVYSATGEPARHHLAATLPFVLYGVARYLWLVLHEGRGDNPTALAWADVPIIATVLLWAVLAAILVAV